MVLSLLENGARISSLSSVLRGEGWGEGLVALHGEHRSIRRLARNEDSSAFRLLASLASLPNPLP